MIQISNYSKSQRGRLVTLTLLVLLLYAVIPQIRTFHSSWKLLRRPDLSWLILALGLTAITYVEAALTYCFLALKPLKYGPTFIIQLAAMFVNRLVPAGIGAIGVNYVYLKKKHFSVSEAGSMVAINNLLGFLGHGILLILASFFVAERAYKINLRFGDSATAIKACLVIALLAVIAVSFLSRRRYRSLRRSTIMQVKAYKARPWRLISAWVSSITLTLTNVACLVCSGQALGAHLPFAVWILIFTFGVGVGAATPTPGGLGGFEAGLVGALVAYRVGSAEALAIALLYRLVSYWVPLVAGGAAFFVVRRRAMIADL